LSGVLKADALFGTPDAVAVIEGSDIRTMDTVVDRIVEVPGVIATDSRVVRKTMEMEQLVARHSAIMDTHDPRKKTGLIVDE
jgi:hypothetical protein